jgi:TM2 domain-containing membrane protein YozV
VVASPLVLTRESRGLKAAGLAALAGGGGLLAWLGEYAAAQAVGRSALTPFVLATGAGVNILAFGILLIAVGCGLRPPWRWARGRHALALQLVLTNLLVPPIAYGLMTRNPTLERNLAETGWDAPISLAIAFAAVLAWRLWRRAQQYEAPDADDVMARDPRPPVLYLRSFQDDGDPVLIRDVDRVSRWLYGLWMPNTPEQEVADLLDRIGPVIAIGKPGEPLPELGAARLYVSHDRWQARVQELMAGAALVVIRVGASAGVVWEIEQALQRLPRERLLLLLIGEGTVAAPVREALALPLGDALDAALPQPQRQRWFRYLMPNLHRRIGGVIGFDAAGRPHPIPVTMWPIWGRDVWLAVAFRPSALPLRRAFRQVFERIGRPTHSFDAGQSRGLAVLLAILAGWAGAHWFYLGNSRRGRRYLVLLPLMVPAFLSLYDALRFVWIDRAAFEQLARPDAPAGASG